MSFLKVRSKICGHEQIFVKNLWCNIMNMLYLKSNFTFESPIPI